MSIEFSADWDGLRQVANVAQLTLKALADQVRPGVTTGELDATAARLFVAHADEMAPFISLVAADPHFGTTCLVPVGNGEFLAVKTSS
jgi:Xaa-Pro aminopeptidase